MTKHSLTTAAVAVALGSGAVCTAYASSTPGLTVSATPNKAKAGTKISAAIGGAEFLTVQNNRNLKALELTGPAGLKIDTKAVKVLCTKAQSAEKPPTCPADSKVGTGSATFTATAVGDVNAPLELFLTEPLVSGDIAGISMVASALGTKLALTARVRPASGGNGPQLLAEDVDKAIPLPIVLKDMALNVSAKRVIREKVKKRVKVCVRRSKGKCTRRAFRTRRVFANVTHHLVTNPPACPAGGWTYKSRVSYTDGSSLAPAAKAACTK